MVTKNHIAINAYTTHICSLKSHYSFFSCSRYNCFKYHITLLCKPKPFTYLAVIQVSYSFKCLNTYVHVYVRPTLKCFYLYITVILTLLSESKGLP